MPAAPPCRPPPPANRLSEKWRSRGRPTFRTRFGLHTGPAVVGNVGARDRINYTLVGAVANQASRLEGLNKVYGTEILASGEVAGATADRFVWRYVDRIVAAGTTEAHDIYEPLGEVDAAARACRVPGRNGSAGASAYDEGRFEAALAAFRAAAALRPGDRPCRVFIERCTAFLRDGTPEGWNGSNTRTVAYCCVVAGWVTRLLESPRLFEMSMRRSAV